MNSEVLPVEIFYIGRAFFSFFDPATSIRVTVDALFRRNYSGVFGGRLVWLGFAIREKKGPK